MMDGGGRKIFQSICHPQFPSHPQETGLMSWSIQAGFCQWEMCVCVCLCKWVVYSTCWCRNGRGMNLFSISVRWTFIVEVCVCVCMHVPMRAEVKEANCHHLLPGNTRWHHRSDNMNAHFSSWLSRRSSPNPKHVCYTSLCLFDQISAFISNPLQEDHVLKD